MPRRCPPEIRRQVVELARAGTRVKQLGDVRDERGGDLSLACESRSTAVSSKARAPTRRWSWRPPNAGSPSSRLSLPCRARSTRSSSIRTSPKSLYPVIASLTGQGIDVRHAWRSLGVSESGYYAWKARPGLAAAAAADLAGQRDRRVP
jgi:hypothetical protein